MRKPENNGTRRISMKSKGTKALCILLAAGMLCSCGSEGLKRRDDTSSAAETTTVTETTTTTAQSSSVAETTTTTTTKKKKKKSNELQMLPEGCYDITPLIKAHQTGDRSKLNPTQEEILDEALGFISDCTSEDMTPVEKEIAVHDKLILETDYDSGQLSPLGDYSEDSETPYGTLINHCAICSGYAVTFNLLMKLMGIECITVEGSRSDGKPHMWNQVKLGKDWYCVDVTWDDNNFDKGTLFVKHKYLNCTTEFMKECGHDFEEADYPAAKGTKFSYMNTLMTKDPVYITNMAEFEALFNRSRENNTGEAVFIPDPYFMDPTYPFLSSTALIEEIKQLCIDNDCWYLETVPEMTENGLAAMVLFRTIEEDEIPKEDESSEDESSGSESAKDESSKAESSKEATESVSEAESSAAPESVTESSSAGTESEESSSQAQEPSGETESSVHDGADHESETEAAEGQ